jgi:carbon storage regulator CsrA
MLVLSRKKEETILVEHKGETLRIKVTRVRGENVGLGFSGSRSFNIRREEVDATVQVQQVADSQPLDSASVSAGVECK